MSFYNSLNLTLFSPLLFPSPFMPLSLSLSEFLFSCLSFQSHCIGTLSLSLSRNFLKLKLDYKSYMYMLNYIYIYIWRSIQLLIGMQNPQPLASSTIVGTWKSPSTTALYTSNGALQGVVRICAGQFCRLRAKSEQAYFCIISVMLATQGLVMSIEQQRCHTKLYIQGLPNSSFHL